MGDQDSRKDRAHVTDQRDLGVSLLHQRTEVAEVFRLRTHGMQQEQGWATSTGEIAQ